MSALLSPVCCSSDLNLYPSEDASSQDQLAGGTHVNCSTILGLRTLVPKGDLMPRCKQLGINVGELIIIWALLQG